jgi:hypothetical protein
MILKLVFRLIVCDFPIWCSSSAQLYVCVAFIPWVLDVWILGSSHVIFWVRVIGLCN